MLTARQQFKFGFLLGCAESGLSIADTHVVVKEALSHIKAADGVGVPDPVQTLRQLPAVITDKVLRLPLSGLSVAKATGTGLLTNVGLPLLIGGPFALGGAAGIAAAGMTDTNQETPEETKSRELIEEYRRYAERARYNTSVEQSKLHAPRRGRPLI